MKKKFIIKKANQIVVDLISLEEREINDFLSEEPDNNILIYLNDKLAPICFKRQYLETIIVNNEFLECKFKNKQLMPTETKKGKPFFRIGYYLYDRFINFIINEKSIKLLKNKKQKIFHLNMNQNDGGDNVEIKAINKEYLNLSIIGLNKNSALGKNDVYFDAIFNMALRDYSYRWDAPINYYLRNGDIYFESHLFTQYWTRYYNYKPEYISNIYEYNVKASPIHLDTYFVYPTTKDEAIQNIKDKIKYLDTCFIEAAPRIEEGKTSFWRGMKENYPITDIGDTYTIPNFLSTSKSMDVALSFIDQNNNCCLYEFIPDNGIPYIDMKLTTEFKQEKEILFPRNLKLTYLSEYQNNGKQVKRVSLSLSNENQFVIPTGCKNMYIGTIEPMLIAYEDNAKDNAKATIKPQKNKTTKNKTTKNKTTKNKTTKKNIPEKNIPEKNIPEKNAVNIYQKEINECNLKNKDYNSKTKKCVTKCKDGKQRNENFRCVVKKNVSVKNKLNKTECNKKNKDYNAKTNKCVIKCKDGKERNANFRCVVKKTPVPQTGPQTGPQIGPQDASAPTIVSNMLSKLIIKDKNNCSSMIKTMGKEIASGGFGAIFELSNGALVKKSRGVKNNQLGILTPEEDLNNCITGKGCKNDIILEGLVMHALSNLNSDHFVQIQEFYHCDNDYYIVMENLNGMSFSDLIKNKNLDIPTQYTILFQITYALYLASTTMSFVHGDLTGKNIMITPTQRKLIEYTIGKKKFKIDNLGIRVVLIDFGFSRIKYNNIELYQTYRNPENFKSKEDLFNGAADICKVYSNPTLIKNIDMSIPITTDDNEQISLNVILQRCKTSTHWSHVAIPPFPNLSAKNILTSDLFEPLYQKYNNQ